MKYILTALLTIFYLFSGISQVFAASDPAAPKIQGEAAYLIDVQSGQTLFSKNGDELLQPASTTKIMTGLLAIEQGDLDDVVTASETMLDYQTVYGTRIYLEPGEQLTLEDMLYALLLNSANDAAVAIAEHIGGDVGHFTEMMNQRAQDLGLKNTTFKNPSGLSEAGHLTTAHDLARIAQAAYANPVFRDYIKTKSHVIPRAKENVPIEMINENKLLWQNSMITGMKTGYTSAAGNCFVASASKDGRELIGVILKSPGGEIFKDMQNLLNYGFDNFENSIYKANGDSITQIQVQDQPVNLVTQQTIYVTHPKNGPDPDSDSAGLANLQFKLLPFESELNQVAGGQILTYLEVREGESLLTKIPLVADRTVEPKEQVHMGFSGIPFLLIIAMGGLFLSWKRRRMILAGPSRRRRQSRRRTIYK